MPKHTFKSLVVAFFFLTSWPLVLNAQVIISEVMYDPSGKDEGHEWVEIYNKSSQSVRITTGGSNNAWRFSDGSQHALTLARGSEVLDPGAYAVIVDSALRFFSDQPGFSGTVFDSSVSLNNLLDDLSILSSKNGQVLNQVFYSSSQGARGDGNSLQIQENNSWISSVPTPGFQNSNKAITQDSKINKSEASAHYSGISQSDRNASPTLGIGIGRDRIGAAGSPMEFRVETNLPTNQYSTFLWNFGDGTLAGGSILSHTYQYPGDYVVVLNSTFLGKGEAVSRINVKIIDPQLVVTFANQERIEIKNNSSYEISLFGRALVSDDKFFAFSKDTILGPLQSLSFGSSVTNLNPQSTSDVFIAVLGDSEQPKFREKIEEQKRKQIDYIKNQIQILQEKIKQSFSN